MSIYQPLLFTNKLQDMIDRVGQPSAFGLPPQLVTLQDDLEDMADIYQSLGTGNKFGTEFLQPIEAPYNMSRNATAQAHGYNTSPLAPDTPSVYLSSHNAPYFSGLTPGMTIEGFIPNIMGTEQQIKPSNSMQIPYTTTTNTQSNQSAAEVTGVHTVFENGTNANQAPCLSPCLSDKPTAGTYEPTLRNLREIPVPHNEFSRRYHTQKDQIMLPGELPRVHETLSHDDPSVLRAPNMTPQGFTTNLTNPIPPLGASTSETRPKDNTYLTQVFNTRDTVTSHPYSSNLDGTDSENTASCKCENKIEWSDTIPNMGETEDHTIAHPEKLKFQYNNIDTMATDLSSEDTRSTNFWYFSDAQWHYRQRLHNPAARASRLPLKDYLGTSRGEYLKIRVRRTKKMRTNLNSSLPGNW